MSLSPHEYIHHILDEIDYIVTQISDMDYNSWHCLIEPKYDNPTNKWAR